MSSNTPSKEVNWENTPNITIASIDFFYDGSTGEPKYQLKQRPTEALEPVAVYAAACHKILKKYHLEIIQEMSGILGISQSNDMVH